MDRPGVVLYDKPRCSLCDKAWRVVESVCQEAGLVPERVNVLEDPERGDRYRLLVPVLEIDGRPVFSLTIDATRLRARLFDAVPGPMETA